MRYLLSLSHVLLSPHRHFRPMSLTLKKTLRIREDLDMIQKASLL